MGVPGITLLGPVPATTSSSSAANADDPRVPFGLGDLLLGDPDPELAPSADVPPPGGRAIGAIGRVIGPGPDASVGVLRTATEPRRPCPGASIGAPGADVEARGVFGLGGPIGDGAPAGLFMGTPIPIGIPRLKAGSNGGGGPALKLRDIPEGRGVPGG